MGGASRLRCGSRGRRRGKRTLSGAPTGVSSGLLIFVALCVAYGVVGYLVVRASATRVRVQRVLPRPRAKKRRALSESEREILGELAPAPPAAPPRVETTSNASPPKPADTPPSAHASEPPATVVALEVGEVVVAEVPAPEAPAPASSAPPAPAHESLDSPARSDLAQADPMQEVPALEPLPAAPATAPSPPANEQEQGPRPLASTDDPATNNARTPEEPDTPASLPPTAAPAGEDNTDMSSKPVDLPTWMEDSPAPPKASIPPQRSHGAREPAAPLPSDPEASDNAEPTVVYLMSPEEVAAEERAHVSAPPTIEPLKALTRVDQDRKKALSDLEACTRALSEIEKRASQSTSEVAKHFEALSKEHSQCERVRREIETRANSQVERQEAELGRLKGRLQTLEASANEAKEMRQRADALQQELQGARKEIESATKSREELNTRLSKQESDLGATRTRAQSAEEQAKVAQARITELERTQEQSNLEFAQELDARTNERDRALGELQQREATIQTLTMRCVDQEQRTVTLQNEAQAKDAANQELQQRLAELQRELEERTRAYDAQRAVVEAAQSVMAELRPKLQILETQLTRPA